MRLKIKKGSACGILTRYLRLKNARLPLLFSNSRSSMVREGLYSLYVEHPTANINVSITVTLCDGVLSIPYAHAATSRDIRSPRWHMFPDARPVWGSRWETARGNVHFSDFMLNLVSMYSIVKASNRYDQIRWLGRLASLTNEDLCF